MKKATSGRAKSKSRQIRSKSRRKSPTRADGRRATNGDEMRPEYDFSGGVRGKYADRFAASRPIRVVVLAPDVAEEFTNARAVNAALRRLLKKSSSTAASKGSTRRTA